MEKKLSILVCLLLLAVSGHGLRILHDVDGDFGQGFAFGSKAAAADETEPLDPLLDDYENEISHLEFEPVDAGSTPYAAGMRTRRRGSWAGGRGGAPPAATA